MFWKRTKETSKLPRVMVCRVDPDETQALAKQLTEHRICEALPLLTDVAREAVPICQAASPDLLVLEAMPDAMEKLDDPDKDISGRCELAAEITEVLPACRAYLTCAEEFRHLEPVMQKAVETNLICGYCFGDLTEGQLRAWLAEGEVPKTTGPCAGSKRTEQNFP